MKTPEFFLIFSMLIMMCGCTTEKITSIQSSDDVTIKFDNIGKGNPAIIFVHGWANNRTIWDTQVKYFSKNHQVIAVDLPGFGESGDNRMDWTMEAFGEDISKIIKDLKLKQVVLVGFSMGAPVVIEAAKLSPDQTIGVVLVDDIQDIEFKITPEFAHFIDSMMIDLIESTTVDKLVQGGFFRNNVDSSYQRVLKFLDRDSRIGWRESLAGYMNWYNNNCTNSVKSVKAPIIAINSDQQPTNIEAFRKYAPTFEVKIVHNVGHVIMWDNTEEFNRLLEESIQEFLNHK